MSKSRFFRGLVCFLVICCLMFSYIALPSLATTVVVPAATKLTLDAILAIIYSIGMGVVVTDVTVEAWNRAGLSLNDYIITDVDTTTLQAYTNLKAYWESIDPDPPEDPSEWKNMLEKALSRGMLTAIAGWVCGGIISGGLSSKEETSSWLTSASTVVIKTKTYDILTPQGAEYLPFVIRTFDGSSIYGIYFGVLTPSESVFCSGFNTVYESPSGYIKLLYSSTSFDPSDIDEVYYSGFTDIGTYTGDVMSFFETLDFSLYGSTTEKTIIEPTIYVGDLPQEILDGEKDKNNIVLPLLDPYELIQSPETALVDLNKVQTQLANGDMTLEEYLDKVTFKDPSTEDPSDPTDSTEPSTDTETWNPPQDPGMFTLDLKDIFPFCIPFDLYAFLSCLNAAPVAPVISWELALPGGGSYPIEIDLSPFNSVAQLLRRLQLLLFIVGLAIKTRDLIKG